MCCWAVATAFPGVCLQNNEAWRNWDEFFMILDDRAEDIGGDLFLILPVFTNRMELGILGCEVPPDWNSTSGGVWRAECGKFVWGVWKSEFSKSVRGGNRSPRDLGLCWGRCWDNRDRFFHGKGKGAVPGAAGKKKNLSLLPRWFFGNCEEGKASRRLHAEHAQLKFPLNPSNGHREWEESPGSKPWESCWESPPPQKKIPNLQRCWKGSRGAENVLWFVGWGWRGLKKNRG